MYRKYQSSTKSSRNERLAQLSEQESVIEKKKKEILAKLEAQKKKEVEEALKKLESPNAPKQENIHSFKRDPLNREKNVVEEPKSGCPRNAFSNDGSFLDQFKKLSGLSQKNVDLSQLAKAAKKEESSRADDDVTQRQGRLARNEVGRRDCENEQKTRKFDNSETLTSRSFHNTNQQQLPSSTLLHYVPQVPVSKPVNTNFTHRNSHFKAISPYSKVSDAIPYQSSTTDSNSHFPVSPTESPSSLVQMQNIPQSHIKEHTTDERKSPVFGERYSEVDFNADRRNRKLRTDDLSTLPQTVNTMSKTNSPAGVEESRVSPALSDDEGDDKDGGHSWEVRHVQDGEDSSLWNRTSNRPREAEGFKNEGGHAETDCEEKYERKSKNMRSGYDSCDSDTNSKDSYHSVTKASSKGFQLEKDNPVSSRDGYQADYKDEANYSKISDQRQKKFSFHKASVNDSSPLTEDAEQPQEEKSDPSNDSGTGERRKRKRKSRWGDEVVTTDPLTSSASVGVTLPTNVLPISSAPGGKPLMLSKLTRSDPGLIQYARQTFGSTNLSEEDWKKAEDHYKINLLYQDMVKKRAEIDRLEKAGKFKYEYDSDEDVEGGTWEHKLRQQEMMATQLWAEELTRQAAGKHHIGDFLPPEELERFMEKYNAVKQGRNPDLSDYKEFKLKEDNIGYRLLQKMGWNEGQGLGQDGTGITNPVNKAQTRHENQGLGVDRPDGLQAGDDEYDAYRKRMMLAYRFRPNPLNNPRRPYY